MEFLLQGHEFNLKGANRGFFTTRLRANLERMLTGCGCRIGMRGLGLAVECPDAAAGEVRTRLQRALGVQTIVAGRRVEADPAAIAPVALEMIAAQSGASFALNVLRPDKALPLSSYEVAVAVGRYIEERLQLPVDLRQPQRRCTIVLSRKGALVSRAPEPGPGGMPAGTAGRLLGLLSTGFDSPVAAFRLIRRGGRVMLVHFYASPLPGRGASPPVAADLARQLTRYQLFTRLYLCPFEPAQRAIVAHCPSRYRILLYRRMMLRISAALAEKIHAHGLVTGDSLAQVASQTSLNLEAVSAAVRLPIYRPLIGDDKIAIQAEARRIGTFDISTAPTDDCCSAFMPRSPALTSSPAELEQAEAELDLPALVSDAMTRIETVRLRVSGSEVLQDAQDAAAEGDSGER
ncbi:MAG TPA: THUMP domain-containing protein [Terriglobales bacterium]|nr:THUMP domain-containing protein [Terriglobales bacterium]